MEGNLEGMRDNVEKEGDRCEAGNGYSGESARMLRGGAGGAKIPRYKGGATLQGILRIDSETGELYCELPEKESKLAFVVAGVIVATLVTFGVVFGLLWCCKKYKKFCWEERRSCFGK